MRHLIARHGQMGQNRQRGFNLIEIMVVVVIIGLLASIVAPMVGKRADEARVQKAKADMDAIKTALKLYQLDNFNYPTSEQGLDALVSKPSQRLFHVTIAVADILNRYKKTHGVVIIFMLARAKAIPMISIL